MFCEALPFAHLGIRKKFVGFGDLCQRRSPDHLGNGGLAGGETLYGKDGTAAYLASRNTLCRPREAPESDGRKSLHKSLSIG